MKNKLILLLIPITFGLFACNLNTNTSSSSNKSNNTNNSSSIIQKYNVGKTATSGDLQYTFNNLYNTKKLKEGVLEKETQNNYIVVNFSVLNISNNDITLYYQMLFYHIGEATYSVENELGFYVKDSFNVYTKIGPGLTQTFNVVFEIPSEFKVSDYLEVKGERSESPGEYIYIE